MVAAVNSLYTVAYNSGSGSIANATDLGRVISQDGSDGYTCNYVFDTAGRYIAVTMANFCDYGFRITGQSGNVTVKQITYCSDDGTALYAYYVNVPMAGLSVTLYGKSNFAGVHGRYTMTLTKIS